MVYGIIMWYNIMGVRLLVLWVHIYEYHVHVHGEKLYAVDARWTGCALEWPQTVGIVYNFIVEFLE